MTAQLIFELEHAVASLNTNTSMLGKLGIDLNSIYAMGEVLGLLHITPSTDGLYECTEDGKPALIVAALDVPWTGNYKPTVFDLAAFYPEEPDRWWLRRGEAVVLGQDYIDAARDPNRLTPAEPVPIFRNPLRWLQAGCQGAVLLKPQMAAVALRDVPAVVAEDEVHGRDLARLLRQPPPGTPRVLVRKQKEAA